MKVVLLMYLDEDEKCVGRLLKEQRIEAYSRLRVEGHGPGSAAGWSGEIQPYQSQMIMSVLADDAAASLMDAVAECSDVEDPRHPIRAVLVDVEGFACCQLSQP